MSRVSVTQFITEDGKIQIDVTNTSGRVQALSREPTLSSENPEHPSPAALRDHDEPCSLIVSLRSSHPQFFFYRGPQPKMITSASVASPLRMLNNNGGSSGGASGHQHPQHRHNATGSALWNHAIVDPSVLEVSKETWKEHGFAPVAPDASVSGGGSSYRRGSDGAVSPAGNAGNASAPSTRDSDDRPLLVREEMADCVLLPGERRTFFLEVSNPSLLTRLLAPKPTVNAVGGKGDLRLQPGHLRGGSDAGEYDANTPNAPFRVQTDVFYNDAHGVHGGVRGGNALRQVSGGGPQQHHHHQQQQQSSRGQGPDGNGASASVQSDRASLSAPSNRIGGNGGSLSDAQRRGRDWDADASDTDEYGRSPSRQPLSIVADSSTTRASVDAARTSAMSSQRQQRQPQQQQQQRRASAGQDSLHSSRDYVVPPSSSEASDSALMNEARGSDGCRPSQLPSNPVDTSPLPAKNDSTRYAPPSPSRSPVFYVYYHPLGDENKCVDRARKWIAKEQHTYHEWRENLVRTVVQLERKREHVWTVTEDNAVLPPQPRLEVKRILPPALGELVRWRSDDGSSGSEEDVMQPSSVTVTAFYYYYARVGGGVGGGGGGRSGSSHSAAGSVRRSTSGPEVPPSFAATRANRVSRKAKKMFTGDRQGAGTVVMPLRVPRQTGQGGNAPLTGRNGSTTSSRPATPAMAHSTSSAGMSRASPQPQQQQQGSGASQHSVVSDGPYAASPPPHQQSSYGNSRGTSTQYTRVAVGSAAGGDDDTDYYAGSATPSDGATRDGAPWRPRARIGRGLALLDDSVTGPPSPSAYASSEACPSSGDPLGSTGDHRSNAFNNSTSLSSRWGRTNTLDPDAAELAARMSTPSLHRPYGDDAAAAPRDNALYSPRDARPALPSFPSTLESARAPGDVLRNSPDLLGTSFPSSAKRLANSNSSSHLNAHLNAENAAAESAEAEEAADAANPGSFVAQLFQSFCGRRDAKADAAGGGGNADDESVSPHVRDISSAPPQRVTYRRGNGVGLNTSFPASGVFSPSFTTGGGHPQTHRAAGRTRATPSRAKILAQQLTENTGTAAVMAFDILNEHGPTAMVGLTTVLNGLKDYVFTPDNVKMMETVITPMVVVFAAVALVYLLFSGGGGMDGALSPQFSGNL